MQWDHLPHLRKATNRAETKVSMEGSKVEAEEPVDVKVAVATVAAPGSVMLRLVPVLTAVSAVANLVASLLEATKVWS